jgi:hypothetical protein
VRKWLWGAIGAAIVLLAAGAAFLAWGPIGIGPGPLTVAFVASTGTVPQDHPAVIIVPIETAASAPAVVDRVGLKGGQGYPSPRLLRVLADPDQACSGIWWPVTGASSFTQRCARRGTFPLLGRVVPLARPALTAGGGARPAFRTVDVSIEVAAPGSAGCWDATAVVINYHVGSRHYTATAAESLSGCTPSADLASDGRATEPPTATPTATGTPPVARPTP